jgi:acetyl esterase/lipase
MTSNVAAEVRIERDVVFGRGGDVDLRLDVYYPAAEKTKRTAIVQLHGGGFTRGAKENIAANCRAFAERGYVAVASQYRLVDQGIWPSQIEDVKAAIRWTRANREMLGVDDDKIAVAGYSAGATVALIAGGGEEPGLEGIGGNGDVTSSVAACLAFYPPDAVRLGHQLLPANATEADSRQASPITYARPGAAPTLLMHATGDTTIPFEASVRLFEAFRAAGVPVEMHLFDGLSHVFDRHPEFAAPAVEVCDLFLDRHVVEPRVYPPFAPGVARPG